KASTPNEKPHVEHMGELAAFYNPQEFNPSNIAPLINEENKPEVTTDVSMGIRFSAWIIDIAAISFMFSTAMISIIFATDMPFDVLNPIMISNDLSTSFIAIFMMFYIFYFTFL